MVPFQPEFSGASHGAAASQISSLHKVMNPNVCLLTKQDTLTEDVTTEELGDL